MNNDFESRVLERLNLIEEEYKSVSSRLAKMETANEVSKIHRESILLMFSELRGELKELKEGNRFIRNTIVAGVVGAAVAWVIQGGLSF